MALRDEKEEIKCFERTQDILQAIRSGEVTGPRVHKYIERALNSFACLGAESIEQYHRSAPLDYTHMIHAPQALAAERVLLWVERGVIHEFPTETDVIETGGFSTTRPNHAAV